MNAWVQDLNPQNPEKTPDKESISSIKLDPNANELLDKFPTSILLTKIGALFILLISAFIKSLTPKDRIEHTSAKYQDEYKKAYTNNDYYDVLENRAYQEAQNNATEINKYDDEIENVTDDEETENKDILDDIYYLSKYS